MKYCFDYVSGGNWLKADELVFKYTENNPNLIKKMESMEDKYRIIIDISGFEGGDVDYEVINAAMEKHPNSALKLLSTQLPHMQLEEGKAFFLNAYCSSYDKLDYCLSLDVSDVYVTDELAFDIVNVYKICKSKKVKIRVFPNVAQNSSPIEPSVTSFFIRPEDKKLYEDYVDVFEFYGKSDRQEVLYDIYEQEQWNGKVNDIITNLPVEVDNYYIANVFGYERLECKKSCLSSGCNICNLACGLSNKIRNRLTEEHKHN